MSLDSVSATDAYVRLLEGNRRFASGTPEHSVVVQDQRTSLVDGQRPFVTVIACVDSRVPLEALFDATVGDLLTIRTAGQALVGAALGSIEFGPRVLGTELVAVVGHTHCGAVGAAQSGDELSGPLGEMVSEIVGRLDGFDGDRLEAERANVAAAVATLRSIHTMVLPDGRPPVIVGLLDDIATGSVIVVDDGGLATV